jgi:hypothetical protein
MPDSLLPPRLLFRFAADCRAKDPLWTDAGARLGPEHRLPRFAELDPGRVHSHVFAAWSPAGLAFSLRVAGKRSPPWCRETRADESDALRLWIATRDLVDSRRANKYCHAFLFLPAGGGRNLDEPVADQAIIARARENARPVRPGLLQARSAKLPDGYALDAFIPAAALTGYDPVENARLGFTYSVVDRELGEQAWTAPGDFPFREDPSLWGRLDLVK